jgi:hypothetical protein
MFIFSQIITSKLCHKKNYVGTQFNFKRTDLTFYFSKKYKYIVTNIDLLLCKDFSWERLCENVHLNDQVGRSLSKWKYLVSFNFCVSTYKNLLWFTVLYGCKKIFKKYIMFKAISWNLNETAYIPDLYS